MTNGKYKLVDDFLNKNKSNISRIKFERRLRSKIKFDFDKVGRLIGTGSEGYVFEYDSDKIIKLIFYFYGGGAERFNSIMKTISDNKCKLYPKVHSYGSFFVKDGCEKSKIYFYITDRVERNIRVVDRNFQDRWDYKCRYLKRIIGRNIFDDVHHENVMLDSRGNEVFIDLTTFCWD